MMAPIHAARRPREGARAGDGVVGKVGLSAKRMRIPASFRGVSSNAAIARSFAMQPEVMLFDEVTAALDPETVKEVLNTIKAPVHEA